MTPTLEVHVIKRPGRKAFVARCIESFEQLPGIESVISNEALVSTTSVLDARLVFIETAVADYISFVDDDKIFEPSIFDRLITAAQSDPDYIGAHAAPAVEFDVLNAMVGFQYPQPFVLKRAVAAAVAEFFSNASVELRTDLFADFSIFALASLVGKWAMIDEVGYTKDSPTINSYAHLPYAWMNNATKTMLVAVTKALEEACLLRSSRAAVVTL